MSYELVFRIEAQQDLEDIREYYNKISPKITDSFFIDFFETMDFIEGEPQLFQLRYRDIRIAPLRTFPYGVHCHYIQNKITIFRILHTKRYFK